jgi:trehalose 6-phosphate synthase/phosphatase
VAGRDAGRLLIAANRLPVTIKVDAAGRAALVTSMGGVATGLQDLMKRSDARWVGWPGASDGLSRAEHGRVGAALRRRRLVPVALSPDEVEEYYEHYANGVLWPLFHSFPGRLPLEGRGWARYADVNARFADRLAALAARDATVWVHDYQLLLVPGLLRARRPDLRIGFFLHIPFPAPDVFRLLPARREILEGLLGADLVGLHTAAYVRNLLHAFAEVLGAEVAGDVVGHEGRVATVGAFPMGVDAPHYQRLSARAARGGAVRAHRRPAGIRLLGGIDRLDYTKGIPRRLLAYERLLEREPALRGHVRLVQVAVPSRENVAAYRTFHSEVEQLIRRIQGRFATPDWLPVHWMERPLEPAALAALYRALDVLLVTPIRDGMNLVAKEFIAARPDEDGVLVLSEFAGAAEELAEALVVNPYDIDATAAAIARALAMPRAERRLRMRALRERVRGQPVRQWGAQFLAALERAAERAAGAGRLTAPDVLARAVERVRRAPRLVLLLDYDGTLVPFSAMPELAVPDPELLKLLAALARRPGTAVHVLSGRDRHTLAEWLGALPIGLHAEHGVWSRVGGRWRRARRIDARWRGPVQAMMLRYVAAVPGARLERKSEALAWHWRGADREFGARQAAALEAALEAMLAEAEAEVLVGHRVVEVRPRGVHKGRVVEAVLAGLPPHAVVVACGDDRTDEDLFAALPPDALSVHVGHGASVAALRVASPAQVRRLLAELAAAPPVSRARASRRAAAPPPGRGPAPRGARAASARAGGAAPARASRARRAGGASAARARA